jgi:hypothetical protein
METNNPKREHSPSPAHTPNPLLSTYRMSPPLLQFLEQVAAYQYKTKALADNQVEVQPATTDSYRAITKALAVKRNSTHTS